MSLRKDKEMCTIMGGNVEKKPKSKNELIDESLVVCDKIIAFIEKFKAYLENQRE